MPTLAVTVFATALAVAAGRDTVGCLLVALAVLSGQLSVGWCNDRVDAVRDTGRTDKSIPDGSIGSRAVAVAAGCALAACIPLSLASGLLAGCAHLVGVAAGWAYNLHLKRTVLSWAPYTVAFGLLPAFVTLGLPGRPWPPGWEVATAALLGVGAHLANVLPDIAADRAAGIRGLPQRLGPARTLLIMPIPLLLASVILVFGPPGPVDAPGWIALGLCVVLAGVAVLLPVATGRTGVAFRAALGIATVDVALYLLHTTT